ncbi:hypothetical protein [Bacillus sp. FJAT-26390]|nr:hypothetical protein [Bacillus sp. FJAT-26390]
MNPDIGLDISKGKSSDGQVFFDKGKPFGAVLPKVRALTLFS